MNFAKGGGVRDIYAPLELINCNCQIASTFSKSSYMR